MLFNFLFPMSDFPRTITDLQKRFEPIFELAKIDQKEQQIKDLQNQMAKPDFWLDSDKAKVISQKASHLEQEVKSWQNIKQQINDLMEMSQMDGELKKEISQQAAKLEKQINKLELNLLFNQKHDHDNAIVAIHAGAGGTDAQDWAEMLLRMYFRFCEKQGWQTNIITISAGSEAGIKSVLFEVIGYNSYGFFKSENGVHRLVRISPFDAEKMRHTSFALVEVLPHAQEEVEIEINAKDLRIDTFRASGHGGQGVNTTDSAVRITHLPTKITVSCQNERSQQQNKETALKILKSKLQKFYETEVEEERQKLRGEFTEAAWGNQVRSYVIHPYKQVKDHRTNFEVKDVDKVLNGDLMPFIEAYLKSQVEN